MPTDLCGDEPACPSCHSLKVVKGTLHSLPNGNAAFTLPNLKVGFWSINPPLQLDRPSWLCMKCGHLWTDIDVGLALEQVRRFGTAELKEHVFGPGANLPRPADAPAPDTRDLPTPSAPER